MRKLGILVALVLSSAVFAQLLGDTTTGLIGGVYDLCDALMSLLPIVAMLMVIVAGVLYAAGQMMGAETRARSNVWATAALTGALIAILIVVIAPPVLKAIYNDTEIEC